MTTFLGEDNKTSPTDTNSVAESDANSVTESATSSATNLMVNPLHPSSQDASTSAQKKSSTQTNSSDDLSILEISPVVVTHWTVPKPTQIKFSHISNNMHQLGYSAEDLMSGNIKWYDLVHPEDLPTAKAAIENAVVKQQENYIQNYRIKQPSGDYRWIENRGSIIRAEDGRVRYFQSLLIDITERKKVEIELRHKTAYLETLQETTLALMHRFDLRGLFDYLVKRLYDLLEVNYVYLSLANQGTHKLQMVAAEGLKMTTLGTVNYGEGLSGKVWASKKALYIEDYFAWEGSIRNPIFENVKSVAGLPLLVNQKVIGVIGIVTQKTTKFDVATIKTLENFAQIASVALDNAILLNNAQKELKKRQKLEKSLALERNALAKQTQFKTELANFVADSLSGELAGDFYQTMLERAIDIIPGANAGSLLVKASSGKYHFKATVNYDLSFLNGMGLDETDLLRDFNSSEILRVYDTDRQKMNHKLFKPLHSTPEQSFKVALTIPIQMYEKTIALFSLDNTNDRDAFSDDTLYLAKIFANQVTALWQRFLLEKNLKKNQNNYKQLFLESNQHSKELQILDKIRSVIATKLELNDLLDTVCESIVDIFGYGRVSIGIVRNDYIVTVASRGTDESVIIPDKSPTSISAFQTIQKTREAIIIPQNSSMFEEDTYKKTTSKTTSKSMMVAPLVSQDEVKGIISIVCEDRDFDDSEKVLIKKIVDQLQISIDNATLHNKIKRDLLRTQALYDVSRAVQDHNRSDGFMDSIIWSIREALNSDWAVIYKMDFKQGIVEHVSKARLSLLPPIETLSFEQLNSGLTGWAIKHQEPVSIINSEDSRENNTVAQINNALNIGSIIIVPLIYQNEVFGTLATLNQKSNQNFSSEDLDILVSVADQASVVLAQYELRKAIEFQAFHDTLTSLPNRFHIENSLNAAIREAEQKQSCFATMFLDLDGFKNVNDTLGHDIGDELLKAVAGRLSTNTFKENTLARMGGDEFAVVIKNLEENDKVKGVAKGIAENYLELIQKPFQIGKHTIKVGASIGISFYPDDGTDLNSLLKHADSAMYQAKYNGKNAVCLFTLEIATKIKDRMEMENDLRQVIEEGGLELHYQPQICLHSDKRFGVEALLRWNHATKGFISPDDFIPISEESKLILDIGKWVIQEACRQNAAWQAEGFEPITVAVNISALQFESPDFMEIIHAALEESGLDPRYLELEVTERIVMNDVSIVVERLNALRSIGIKVSIDDFGTGYSSLQYLQTLPLDKLKIDRSFINELSPNNTPILSSIFILAQNLGLGTIAEGVETKEQLDIVRMLGCDEVQGYYFSKPLPASEVWKPEFAKKNPTLHELNNKHINILSETSEAIKEEAARALL